MTNTKTFNPAQNKDVEATIENIEAFFEHYTNSDDMQHTIFSTYEVTEEENGVEVEFAIEDTEFDISLFYSNTLRELYEVVINAVEETPEFYDYGTSKDMFQVDTIAQKLSQVAAQLRDDAGLSRGEEYETLEARIQEEFENMYTPKSSGITNNEEITEDVLTRLIEDHDLSHGNFEYDEDSEEITVVIEAPNHTTFSVYHHTKEDGFNIGGFRENIAKQIQEFDANDEYDELWSPQFGRHNGFTPDGFYVLLHAAQKFFEATVQDMSKDLKK